MRRAEVIDGNFAVYEDGTINRIVDGVETPVAFSTSTGYYTFSYKKQYLAHRLVAEAFIPNPDNKPFVNHKDANKLNNSVENLEWCTPGENRRHAVRMGLIPRKYGRRSLHVTHKRNGDIRLMVARLKKNKTQKEVAELLGVSSSTVSMWENGVSIPADEYKTAIAEVYGCTIDELFEMEEETK